MDSGSLLSSGIAPEQSPAWFWKLLSQPLQPEAYAGTATLQNSRVKALKDIQIAVLHVWHDGALQTSL